MSQPASQPLLSCVSFCRASLLSTLLLGGCATLSAPAEEGTAGAPMATSAKVSADESVSAPDDAMEDAVAEAEPLGSTTRAAPATPPRSRAAKRAPVASGAPADRAAPEPPQHDLFVGQTDDVAVDSDMSGNTHTDHGVNPFTMTGQDALSTFSIDVDTASYALARRSIAAGALPRPAAVRVEEFINYFDYDSYSGPSDDTPFAVHMEAMPHPFRNGRHVLRVGVQGKEIDRSAREPVHLTFLVDVSGSMNSADKLGLARESMHMMVNQLREDDTVALATYAGRTARVLEPTRAVEKSRIHRAIDALSAGGSTAMSSGIDIAYDMAAQSFVPGHENRVVVMSDGDANVGRTSWDALLSQIKGHADRGITLSTIGLGTGNYRDTLMEQLANNGDGNNFYIDSQAQAQRVFVEQLPGTMVTIARDVKIQVEFQPESVKAYRLIGYENRAIADQHFRNDRVDAGEIGSGHNVTALYEVILADSPSDALATVRMRWEAPGADKAASERAWSFATAAMQDRVEGASRDTRMAFAAATFAEVLRGSPHAEELSMDTLIDLTREAASLSDKDHRELLSLMRTARGLGAGVRSVARRD